MPPSNVSTLFPLTRAYLGFLFAYVCYIRSAHGPFVNRHPHRYLDHQPVVDFSVM